MLRFEEINKDNWRCDLSVSPDQTRYVANSAVLLARAYAYRSARSRAYLICNDDTPIGMSLYYDEPESDAYIFIEFFIDARYQRQGFGKAAVAKLLDEMRADGRYHKVILCYVEQNEAARHLYESFGFVQTDRDGDEIEMELLL